jgi:hypothetical protein
MGSGVPAVVHSIIRAAARVGRAAAVLAIIFVFSVLLGSKAIAKLLRPRWGTVLIGIAIVIPLVLFGLKPASQKTPIGQDKAAASARVDREIEQAAKSEDDAAEAATIEEWRKAVEEVLKEADAGQQAIASGKAEQLDAIATAANTPQAQDPKPTDRQIMAQNTGEVKAAGPIVNDRADSPTTAGASAVEAPQMNGPNESSGVPLVKAEATPSGESGERGVRRVRRGAHHGWGWHYRIHTTGVARMGPVLVFR